MSWNYRIIEFTEKGGAKYRAIHEVFYNEHGDLSGYAENPATVIVDVLDCGEPEENVMALTLTNMMLALARPVLREGQFNGQTDDE